jgi:hypothetical protein
MARIGATSSIASALIGHLAGSAFRDVKRDHPVIDFALVGYGAASLYPHCMADYDAEQMARGRLHASAA